MPLFVEALNRTRGAIIDLNEIEPAWLVPRREPRNGRDPTAHDYIYRWEPWVRSYLVAHEAMEFDGIRTDFVDHPKHGSLRVPRVRLSVLDFERGHRLPLATITSPPPKVFEQQLARSLPGRSCARSERRRS